MGTNESMVDEFTSDCKQLVVEDGSKFYCVNLDEARFLYQKLFAEDEYGRGSVAVEPGMTILDVGGNIGMFTQWATRKVKGDITLLAFEPVQPLHRALKQNAAMLRNEFGPKCTLHTFEFGLSNTDVEIDFQYYPNCTMWSSAHVDMVGETVVPKAMELLRLNDSNSNLDGDELAKIEKSLEKVTYKTSLKRLSAVLSEEASDILNGSPIDLLKIDVEGHELEVLEGIDDADWPRIRQCVAEVHNTNNKLGIITCLLKSKGFEVTVEHGAPPSFLLFRHLGFDHEVKYRDSNMAHVYAARPAKPTG